MKTENKHILSGDRFRFSYRTPPCWQGLEYVDSIPLQRDNTPQKWCPENDTKLPLMVKLWSWIALSAGAVEYTDCFSADE